MSELQNPSPEAQHTSPVLMEFLKKIQSPDGNTRLAAWKAAGPMGGGAVPRLATLMDAEDKGVAKAARLALETVTHHAARPGAGREAKDVTRELLAVARSSRTVRTRAWSLHLLGCVADGQAVPEIAKLLTETAVQEEARMALERIPGSASLNALKKAEKEATPDFRPNLQQSLHNRALTPVTAGTLAAR